MSLERFRVGTAVYSQTQTGVLCAETSSGPSGAYLAAQVLTGVNYVSPVGGAWIVQIYSSVRTADGQVFIYFADDAVGTNAKIVWHTANHVAYDQKKYEGLVIHIPAGKYILAFGVGTIHDTSYSVIESQTNLERYKAAGVCTALADNNTIYASAAGTGAYVPFQMNGASYVAPVGGATILRLHGMVNSTGTVGYVYWADDASGSNANVCRNFTGQGNVIYTETIYPNEYINVPAGKYVLLRAELGNCSAGVTLV